MSEMVRKVAQAIAAAGHEWLDSANNQDVVGWADVPDEVFARAAIAAMLDPTEAQLCAARDHFVALGGRPPGNKDATGCYQAMLSAALAE